MSKVKGYKSTTGHELPGFETPDGVVRMLGYRPSGAGMYAARPMLGNIPLIERKDIIPFDRCRKNVPLMDQGQVGSCNPHGMSTALMLRRSAVNMNFHLFSPCFIYALINGGIDQGSDPSDAIATLRDVGICLDSEVPEGTILKSKLPETAYKTASRFRIETGGFYSFSTFDEMLTAAALGWFFFNTVLVAGNWNQFDKNGSPPAYRGTGNHVTMGGEAIHKLSSGELVIPERNSWGDWGSNGYYNFREAHIENQSYFQGYALQIPTVDPEDTNILPLYTG